MDNRAAERMETRLARMERARTRDRRLGLAGLVTAAVVVLAAWSPLGSGDSGVAGRVIEISSGANHTCARTGEGEVYCWGSNEFGQLGTGTTRFNDPTGRGRCLSPSIQPGTYAPAESSPMIDCSSRPARVLLP